MFPKSFTVFLMAVVLNVGLPVRSAAQATEDKPIVNAATTAKFGSIPNVPKCFTIAVERGDPSAGPSVILARFAPGCVAPWHWHTPSETVMMVSGALELQMKDGKPMVAHHGDFVYMPGHHIHRATCGTASACMVFLVSDAAFDVHWVDAAGQEIPLETALQTTKAVAKPR